VVNDDEALFLAFALALTLAGMNNLRIVVHLGIDLAITLLRARLKVSRPFVHALSSWFTIVAHVHALSSFARTSSGCSSNLFASCSFSFSKWGVQGCHFGCRHVTPPTSGPNRLGGGDGFFEVVNPIRAVQSKLGADLATLSRHQRTRESTKIGEGITGCRLSEAEERRLTISWLAKKQKMHIIWYRSHIPWQRGGKWKQRVSSSWEIIQMIV
jgi:hypothetical protein